MKKNQVYGIAAIVTGVLLFLPLLLAACSLMGVDINFFDFVKDGFKDFATTWMTLTAIGSIATIIAAVALIALGVMLILNINVAKFAKIATYVAGAVALLTAIFAVIYVIDANSSIPAGLEALKVKIGFGTILLVIFAVVSLIEATVLKKLVKQEA